MDNLTQKKSLFFTFFYIITGLFIFLLPIAHAWMIYPLGLENIQTSYSALGGILPWSDAAAYYHGANHLLETDTLDFWNTRRPLNAILFSIRLWLTNDNFRAALIIQALLCGISCLLVVKSVIGTFGKIAGIATLFVLFMFAGSFIPTTMSETLGLTLGCLAFVFLWIAIQTRKTSLFFSAGLILMVGLNARAGAFLVLPLLILWLGYYFKDKSMCSSFKSFNWKITSIFTLGLVCGLLFNFILLKLYSGPGKTGNIMHGNFACVLFGLVSGGKLWNYAYALFPEFAAKPEGEFASFLYRQSFEQFKQNPTLLLLGLFRNWGGLIKGIISFFQSSLPESLILAIFIRILGIFLLFFSIFRLKKNYQFYRNEVGLTNTMLIGMFLSGGIIWTAGGFRTFAVTVPFFAVAFGIIFSPHLLSTSTLKNKTIIEISNAPKTWEVSIAYVLSYMLLVLALAGPFLIKALSPIRTIPHFLCPSNQEAFIVKNISGTPYINVTEKLDLFKKTLSNSIIENKESFLKIMDPNILEKTNTFGLIFDSKSKRISYIMGPLNVFLDQHKWIGLCATPLPETKDLILQAQTFEVLNEK